MVYFLADYEYAAKYPFSSKAKEIMREWSGEIDEEVTNLGFERLKAALGGEITRKVFLHESDAIKELLSYAAARMILSYMRNRFLTNKYAIAEAKRAFAYLSEENDSNIIALANDLGFSTIVVEEGKFSVDVVDFLRFAPRDAHYKLISRELKNGRVIITAHERIRLIEEAIKKYSENLPQVRNVLPAIKKAAERLQALLPKIEPQKISFKEGENPPCIESILELMRKHENVGHTARWLLAVYLINKGMNNENIVKIFSNVPDFNERTTLYQIEHARKRGYKMPNCSSILSYGYCVADCKITNPMGWKGKQ